MGWVDLNFFNPNLILVERTLLHILRRRCSTWYFFSCRFRVLAPVSVVYPSVEADVHFTVDNALCNGVLHEYSTLLCRIRLEEYFDPTHQLPLETHPLEPPRE